MPYDIVKKDGKWCVVKKGGTKKLGCHTNKKGAQNQIKAIYANEKRGK